MLNWNSVFKIWFLYNMNKIVFLFSLKVDAYIQTFIWIEIVFLRYNIIEILC